jgi:plasmid stabilization system protein ParE
MSTSPPSILLTKKADADITGVLNYITEKFGSVYADKFLRKLTDLFKLISHQPFIGRPAKQDPTIRVFVLSKQNKIVYKITESEIVILRVLNLKTRASENF